MHLLVVTQYFWPETFIINDLIKVLVRQGHSVDVLTGKPNYPNGSIFPGYQAQGVQREIFDSAVDVLRVPLRARGSGGARNLILNYLSFVVSGLLYARKVDVRKDYDAILVFAPSPITAAIPAIWLKWRCRSHLAIWVQDLWPESLRATGFVTNKFTLALVRQMVRLIYRATDTLFVQSRAFIEPVAALSLREKVIYYPNSYRRSDDHASIELPEALKRVLLTKFCIVFTGNIGTAQSVETIVEAARKIENLADCQVVLVGSGSMSGWLEAKQQEGKMPNITLAGRLPSEAMPEIFRLAGALLVTLKRDPIFSLTIPSKVQAYLASGRPIVASLDGEGARVVRESGAGVACNAEDANALAQCMTQIFRMSIEERARCGKAGYAYFLEHFEMERQARNLTSILEARMQPRSRDAAANFMDMR